MTAPSNLPIDLLQRFSATRTARAKAKSQTTHPVGKKHLSVQADRASAVVAKLRRPGAVILGDPVGTGKTVVALCAYKILANSVVDYGLIIAPNGTVAKRWREHAEDFGLQLSPAGGRSIWKKGNLLIATRKSLPTRACPNPSAGFVIIDEAHRDLQNTDNTTYDKVKKVASGSRVLLVTATPMQIESSGLLAMLALADDNVDAGKAATTKRAVSAYAAAVSKLLQPPRTTPEGRPDDRSSAKDLVRSLQPAAVKALEAHTLPPYPSKKMGIPATKKPTATLITPTSDWLVAQQIARITPELVGLGHGDMFHRRLDSSGEAFWGGKAGSALEDHQSANAFTAELRKRLGTGVEHPKVQATVDWVAHPDRQHRHVLVFCIWKETQDILVEQLQHRLGRENVVGPSGEIPRDKSERFKDPTAPRLVIVARDNLSESIDLDGARPCVVHHDLAWSPTRITQRHGRVVRVSSGFQKLNDNDVFVPVLDVETDRRLMTTVRKRMDYVTLMLPDVDETKSDQHDPNPSAQNDDIFEAIAVARPPEL
jgi:superfamily II DNA or RNA helicase